MEVTAANFKTVLPEIEKSIKNCTFLSIDCELTGLNVVHNVNAFDTPKQYYEKEQKNCKEFLVIQYGLSLFRYDKEKDTFKQQTYSFYIFRRPINRNVPDQRFLCQTSSIDFLISQGFDFNKLFKEGISYLNICEEDKYRNNLKDNYKRRTDSMQSQQNGSYDVIAIPDNAQQFIDDVVKQIEDFLESDETELQLPKCNAFLRRLIYQTKAEKFGNKISLETRQMELRDRILFATRLRTREEEEEIEKKKYEEQLAELEDFIGFTKVLKIIVDSGKLVIGHNICLDLLHTVDKFLAPLPDDYDEFKDLAHSLFSRILDTKYMSSVDPLKDHISSNVLKHLLDTVSESPFKIPSIEIEEGGQGYNVTDNKEHEAGYDAYITGLSFLSMWNFLGGIEGLEKEEIFSNFNLLKSYINKIFLMVLTDNQYINLAGDDLSPSRDHVFHLTFPKEWKMNNITQLFSPFGNVYISWLDETSAYVGLYKKDQAAIALSTLSQSDTYSIMTYAKRQAALAGKSTPLPSPLVTRKRKSTEGPPPSKRQRSDSFNNSGSFRKSKRSIDPIVEEEQAESEESSSSERSSKVFREDEPWE